MNNEPPLNPPAPSDGIVEERYISHRKSLADAINLKCMDLIHHTALISSDDNDIDQDMTESYARGQIRCIKQATTDLEILLLNFVRSTEERAFWDSKLKGDCDE